MILYTRSEIRRTHFHIFQHVYIGQMILWSAIWFFQGEISDFLSNIFYYYCSYSLIFFLRQYASGCQRAIIMNSKGFLSKSTQNHQTTDRINSKNNLCGREPRGGFLCMACEIHLCLTSISWLLRGTGWRATGKYITGWISCNCLSWFLTHCGCSCAVVVIKITTVQQT